METYESDWPGDTSAVDEAGDVRAPSSALTQLALLRGIVESTGDMIAAEDSGFRYLFFNDAYRREFKTLWGRELVPGTSMLEAMQRWPDQQRKAHRLWSRALSGESFSVTEEFGPTDGERQVYALRFSPVRDARGRQIGAAHVLRNVTEQFAVQRALRDSEARLREAEERHRLVHLATHDVIWDWNLTSGDLSWNEAIETTFGHRLAEVPRTISWWRDNLHPDDRERVLATIDAVLADASARVWTSEYRFRRADGEWAEVLDRGLVSRDGDGLAVRMVGSMLDLTERNAAQRRLNRVLEASPMGAVLGDTSGRVTYANDSYLRTIGYSREQLERGEVRWDAITPAEHLDKDRDAIAQALRRGVSDIYEKEYVRADGARVPVLLACASLGAGELAGLTLDITDRKRSEERLRGALDELHVERDKLTAVIGALPVGIGITDALGNTLSMNGAALRLHGFESEEEMHRELPRYRERFELRRPSGEVLPFEEWPAAKAMRGEFVGGREIVLRNLDAGTERIASYTVVPVRDGAGQIAVVTYVMQDVTDARRIEKALRDASDRFRDLADNISQLAWMADEDGSIFWFNRRWFEYTGTTLDEVRGWGWRKLHHPDHAQRVIDKFQRCLETGEPWEDTFPLRGNDGEYRWFLSRAVPIRSAEGRVVRWFGTNTDVTEQREADRRKDEFLAMLSHELRNPLAPIRNSSYILRHAALGGEQARRAQEIIERQTNHLTRLVDDLLDVTRIARGRIELRRERICLREIVLRAADDFRLTMEERGVAFHIAVPPSRLWVHGDATRIAQAVGNLLHNAAKFTRRGDEVSLSLEGVGSVAEIRVRDTGAGIDPKVLPQVFDPFVQGERTLARSEGGLGLGLAVVKGIVELHGGTVRAGSPGQGRGAEFVVALPLLERPVDADDPTRGAAQAAARRRVLVVDDNRDAAESLADLVGILGHDVEVAYDGPSGIAMARARPPDLVLCDIGLPGMSGYDVARTLRQDGGAMQLYAISGYAQPEDVRKAREAGFDGHVAKPPGVARLEQLLEKLG